VTSLTAAKACAIAAASVVVAVVSGAPASIVARRVPGVDGSHSRGGNIANGAEATSWNEATSVGGEARGVTKAVGVSAFSLGLLLGFSLAMLLRVLMAVPILKTG
jgi:hypothetical protein